MSLLEVQLEARNLLQLRPLFLHSKTTGAAEQSEVVEIAILDSAGMPLADELVKPKRHIRPTSTRGPRHHGRDGGLCAEMGRDTSKDRRAADGAAGLHL